MQKLFLQKVFIYLFIKLNNIINECLTYFFMILDTTVCTKNYINISYFKIKL